MLGGTRFIGKAACTSLVEQGHTVTVLHRGVTPNTVIGVNDLLVDRRDPDALRLALRGNSYDVVVDMMPMGEADVQIACDAMAETIPRLVAISSCDVYLAMDVINKRDSVPIDNRAIDESGALRTRFFPYRNVASMPASLHDYDKILAENTYAAHATKHALSLAILRLPAVYGIGDYQHRVQSILDSMRNTDRISLSPLHASFRMSRSYVENVADAITKVCASSAVGACNVAEPNAYSEFEWHRMIGTAAGWQGEIVVDAQVSDGEDFDGRQHCVLDSSLFRTAYGYTERISTNVALLDIVRSQ
ncbi:hypothetical protein BH10BAC6_BH10BAC6_06790 [soil metagenome]